MNVLLLGSGGREHAITWKMAQSPLCEGLYIAPGNAGTADWGENVDLQVSDFPGIKEFVIENEIDFVIVGPEDPLALGITDFFQTDESLKKVAILGPTQAGAMLESSKDFAKKFMQKHGIPTAAYRTFTEAEKATAMAYVKNHPTPIVMKADGLAAGKGVVICETAEQGLQFLEDVWQEKKFGGAGEKVVIEEFITGIELSVFILTDGKNYILLPEAKDYKRIGDGDTGLNTGGMGTVSPVPFADAEFMQKVEERIIKPTIAGLQKDGIPYKGFMFFGLFNSSGDPFVIEYNVRMGDPETQVVLPRIKNDLLPIFFDAANGNLKSETLEIERQTAVCVVAVSGGYPGGYEKGKVINGLGAVSEKDSLIFHAGTAESGRNIVTSGGRVFAMVSMGNNIQEAADKTYYSLKKLHFEKIVYRKDIGKDLM